MPATTLEQQESRARSLVRHLRALGLRSLDEYREWCNRNGFRRKFHKGQVARRRELQFFREQQIQAVLKRRRFSYASEDQTPPRVAPHKLQQNLPAAFRALAQLRANRKHELQGRQPRLHRRAAVRLIRHLEGQGSSLLSLEQAGEYGLSWLESLATISSYHRHWLRPLEDWYAGGYSVQCQFQRLIRHLFVRYDELPTCLDCCWLMQNDRCGNRLRDLYLHLGTGKNVRHWSLPIPYTRKMSHHFMLAPDNILPVQSIRWGQVRGLGVEEHLAVGVIKSRLGELFENEEFWITFFRWLAAHPDFDERYVSLVVDYLHYQRFVPQFDLRQTRRAGVPLQPNLSMHARDPNRLIDLAQRWYREMLADQPAKEGDWGHAPIAPFAMADVSSGSTRRGWKIRQLMNSDQIVFEGKEMNHCVASYISDCLKGTTTIWTLEYHVGAKSRKLLTIEVDPRHREVIQVRGRSNREATPDERGLLEKWAQIAMLRLVSDEW